MPFAKHPYSARNLAPIVLSLLCCAPAAHGAEPATPDPLAMYFDDSQLVQVATRAPKPITQVAENVTIITAQEIEEMRVHTLYEVLEREVGTFVNYFGADYGSTGSLHLQGTDYHQTLVLIDGVRVNNASGGQALINFIPLPIIKRIEIIKGPASSVWGSSLGGVVNIITKDTGNTAIPKGSAMVTYGKSASRELNADLAGAASKVSYYLNVGSLDSNGLEGRRFHDRESAYGKVSVALPERMSLTMTAGYSDPYYRVADFYSLDISETIRHRNFWGTLYFDAPIRDSLSLHLEVQRYAMDHFLENHKLGLSTYAGYAGSLLQNTDYNEQTSAMNGRLNWTSELVDVTMGAETSRSWLDYAYNYDYSGMGPWIGSDSIPTIYAEQRGAYANATFKLGKATITPGLRHDYHSIAGEFSSPSLGATYQLASDTLLRGTMAKGFSAPSLGMISGASVYRQINPLLKPEIVESVQAGIETFRVPGLQLKANLFHHDVTDIWQWDDEASMTVNQGRTRYRGTELSAKTQPWHDLSLTVKGASVVIDSATLDSEPLYSAGLVLDYKDRQSLKAQLAGRYIWYSTDMRNENPQFGTFLWDASLTKTIAWQRLDMDVFLAVHNLFSGSQYWDYEYQNSGSWAEVGAVFRF